MASSGGAAMWSVAWQSGPAHVRGRGRGSSGVEAGTVLSLVPEQEPSLDSKPDSWPLSEPEFGSKPGSVSRPGPGSKPKPIWHALPQQRAGTRAADGDLQELGVRIRSMAADLAASTCEWLHLIEQFDKQGGWSGVGIASCAAWLSWTCSVSPATAREYVRVARSLPLLPQIDEAFAAGKLSYSKVRVMVSVAAEVDESTLLKQAAVQTVSQLERTVRAFKRGGGWSHERARRASWRWDGDGMLVVSARLPPDEGALLIAALEQSRKQARDECGRDSAEATAEASAAGVSAEAPSVDVSSVGGSSLGTSPMDGAPKNGSPTIDDEDRRQAALTKSDPLDVARADMLVDLARRSLAAGQPDSSGDDRHLVMVHVDLFELQDQSLGAEQATVPVPVGSSQVGTAQAGSSQAGSCAESSVESSHSGPPAEVAALPGPRCHIENGPGLNRDVARRIACDAALVAVIHNAGKGEPLRLGRKTRDISPAQRRALRVRDGGCQFPGCNRRTFLNAHHVQPWSLFGPTDLDNLVSLCRFHHMLVHEGGFTVAAAGTVATAAAGAVATAAGAVAAASGEGTDQGDDAASGNDAARDDKSNRSRQHASRGRWLFHDPYGELVTAVDPLPGRSETGPILVQAIDPAGLLPEWRGEPVHLAETVGVLATSPRMDALVGAVPVGVG